VKRRRRRAASHAAGDAQAYRTVLNDTGAWLRIGDVTTTRSELMMSAEEAFRRLAIGDTALLAAVADPEGGNPGAPRLDERMESLIRVAVLVPLDAPQSSYRPAVEAALRAGASLDDLLATLVATAASVGSPRVVAAAPRIALAAGYDVDQALEETGPAG
jgi:alkylhydroperoxidase/carboxymuconolactone decarboxylase family protein YurZ